MTGLTEGKFTWTCYFCRRHTEARCVVLSGKTDPGSSLYRVIPSWVASPGQPARWPIVRLPKGLQWPIEPDRWRISVNSTIDFNLRLTLLGSLHRVFNFSPHWLRELNSFDNASHIDSSSTSVDGHICFPALIAVLICPPVTRWGGQYFKPNSSSCH